MQQPEQQQQQQQRNHIASVRLLLLLFLIIFTTAWGLASARSLEPKGTKGLLPLSIFSNSDRVLLHFPPLARDQPPPLEFLTDLEPFLLDVRGNIVRNTVLESTWAILLLDQLRSVQLFCDLLNGFRNSEALLAKIREKMLNDRSFSFAFADFNCDEVAEAPNMYDLEAGRAKRRLFWTTVAASQWKDVLDLHDAYLKSLEGGKEYYQRMRDNELFRIRGRIVLDSQEAGVSSVKHLRGRTSVLDKTGGIVCERYARTLLPDGGEFFSLAISHAKNLFVASRLVQLPLPSSLGDSAYVRLDDKVSNCFGVHGAPFIAGPSGSTQSIGASMLRDFVTSDTEFAATRVASLKLAESYLIIYMAYLVVAGHHSLVEGLLGCQSAGYFADIRFPLAGPGAYEQALKDLHSRAAELGLIWSDGGLDRPLSEKRKQLIESLTKKGLVIKDSPTRNSAQVLSNFDLLFDPTAHDAVLQQHQLAPKVLSLYLKNSIESKKIPKVVERGRKPWHGRFAVLREQEQQQKEVQEHKAFGDEDDVVMARDADVQAECQSLRFPPWSQVKV